MGMRMGMRRGAGRTRGGRVAMKMLCLLGKGVCRVISLVQRRLLGGRVVVRRRVGKSRGEVRVPITYRHRG
jgi:hypothetical protein